MSEGARSTHPTKVAISVMRWFIGVIGALVLVFVLARASYRVAAPFWSRQPVFHPYRLDLWFNRGLIAPQVPSPDRDVDRSLMTTSCVSELGKKDHEDLTVFISNYFLRTERAVYTPEWKHISMGMDRCQHPSLFCRGRDTQGQTIAAISARPLSVALPGRPRMWTYYVDNLCVHPGHRRSGIAPKAIRTVYQDLREKNREIQTCLFKREGSVMGIMPLTVIDVWGYQAGALRSLARAWPSHAILRPKTAVECRETWEAALGMAASSRVVVSTPSAAAVHALLSSTLYAYAARSDGATVGVALFREPACTYEGERTVELAAVVHEMDDNDAVHFMAKACKQACKDTKYVRGREDGRARRRCARDGRQ